MMKINSNIYHYYFYIDDAVVQHAQFLENLRDFDFRIIHPYYLLKIVNITFMKLNLYRAYRYLKFRHHRRKYYQLIFCFLLHII